MAYMKKWNFDPAVKATADGSNPAGATGHQGITGAQGIQGPAAHTGLQGATGNGNVIGATGGQGVKGDTGAVGPGPGGATATLYIEKIGGLTGVLGIAAGIITLAS